MSSGEGHRNETRSVFTSSVGGVMTEEVGAVTGDLELATRPHDGGVEVAVRYAGADEWYTVEGSPIGPANADALSPFELRELHELVARHLMAPGVILEGNEQPNSLLEFSPVPDDM